MNKDRLRAVADKICDEQDLFDQEQYGSLELTDGYMCGTPGCVAGWAYAVFADVGTDSRGHLYDSGRLPNIHEAGRAALDLTVDEADVLFDFVWPISWAASDDDILVSSSGGNLFTPTALGAASILRRIADGEIVIEEEETVR